MKFLSKVLTYLFHPIVVTSYIFWVLLFHYPYITITNDVFKWVALGAIFFLTTVVPSLAIIGMKRMDIISELKMDNVKERRIPYVVTTVIYAVASYWFYTHQEFGPLISKVLAIVTVSMLVTTAVSFFWKISAHSLGVGGLVGLCYWIHYSTVANYLWLLGVAILIAGAVMTARLYLKAHDGWQVSAGFIVGVVLSVVSYPMLQ